MTRLGDMQRRGMPAATVAVPAASGRFAAAIAGTRPARAVRVVGLDARMEIVSHDRTQAIEAEVFRRMRALGFELDTITSATYEAERARLTLAEAVRDPVDPTRPIGTVEEWGQLADDELVVLWLEYGDLRATVDPLSTQLSEEDGAAIADAVSKKNRTLLRSFGLSRLVSFLSTSGGPPSSSPTPRSTSSSPSELDDQPPETEDRPAT